jgi:hypothetical protein
MQEAQRCLASVVFNPSPTNPSSPSTPLARLNRDSTGPASSNFAAEPFDTTDRTSNTERRPSTTVYDSAQEPPSQLSQTSLAYTSYTSDNRSSLAYMEEEPASTPAPVQTKPIKRTLTPVLGGPPAAYSASNGLPRHGVRDEPSSQYEYDENATWARNHSQAPVEPASPTTPTLPQMAEPHQQQIPLPIPQLPVQPSHFSSGATSLASFVPPVSPTTAQPPHSPLRAEAGPMQRRSQQFDRQPPPTMDAPAPLPRPPPLETAPSRSYYSAREKPSTPRISTPDVPSSPAPRSPTSPAAPPYYPLSHEETQQRLSQSLPTAPPRLSNNDLIYTGSSSKTFGPSGPTRKPPLRSESALGSRFGFDDPAYKPKDDPNNLSQSSYFPGMTPAAPNASKDNTAPPSGYTYHRPNEPPRITAAAFRRQNTGGREAAYPEGSVSPAAQIREAYLQQQQSAAQVAMSSDSPDRSREEDEMAPTAPLKLGVRNGDS